MSRTARLLDWLIEGGLIGLLVCAPLPFGSVLPWAQAAIESVVALLCALLLARMLSEREITLRLTPLLWPGLVMVVVIGFQLIRPGGSVSPYVTEESFRLYLAYLGLLVVLGAHLVTRARIARLVSLLVAAGVAFAALGLTNQALGLHRILWFPKKFYLDRLTSTFVNPNHQALYLSVPLFLALGLLLRAERGRRGPARPEAGAAPSPVTLATRVLLVGAVVVMATALLLTASRGGVLSSLAGLLVVLMLSLHGRVSSRLPVILGVAVVLFVIYASGFGLDLVMERFSTVTKEPFGDLRWAVWDGTLRVVADAPLLGVGLGAFEDAFRTHQPLAIWSGYLVDYAHNDYLQLLAETGLVGLLVGASALVVLAVFVVRRWVTRQDVFVRGLTMGGLGALTAVAAHSATDFGLHMPANGLLAVTLGALLPAVVTLRLHRIGYRVDLAEWRLPLSSLSRRAAAVAALVACVLAIAVPVPRALADWYWSGAAETASAGGAAPGGVAQSELARSYADLLAAGRLDPWNPRIQATLAGVAAELARRAWSYGVTPDGRWIGASSPMERLGASAGLFATAYEAYEQSLAARPRGARTHERFGWFLGSLESVRQRVRGLALGESIPPVLVGLLRSEESLIPRALDQFRQATQWDPNTAEWHRGLALFELAHLDEVPDGRELVAQAFRRALTIDRSMLGQVVDSVMASRLADVDTLWAAVPPQPVLLVDLAGQLERRGRPVAATATLERALSVAADAEQEVEARLAYGRVLRQRNDVSGALAQLRRALVLAPRDPEVFAALGEAYEAGQQWSDAEAAFGSAMNLASSPKSSTYQSQVAAFLTRRGELDRALALRNQIVRDAPTNAWAHVELGKLLEQRGEGEAAFREYRRAETLGTRDSNVTLWLARAYVRLGLLREGASAYEAALRLAPQWEDVRIELTELYTRMGRPQQPAEQGKRALASQPNHRAAPRGLTSGAVAAATASGS